MMMMLPSMADEERKCSQIHSIVGGRSQSVGPVPNVDGSPKRQVRSGSAVPGSAVAIGKKKTPVSTPTTIAERRPRPSEYFSVQSLFARIQPNRFVTNQTRIRWRTSTQNLIMALNKNTLVELPK